MKATWDKDSCNILGPLHKTFTGGKKKSENSGKHEFTIDFTIDRKLWLK